jgi:hypothetical protein
MFRPIHAMVCALALAGASLAPAWAADAARTLEPALGRTIVSTHPDGRKARLWLSRDGSYAAEGRAGQRSGGHWTLMGDKLCLTQSRPIPIPFSYCKPVPPVEVGKPWRDVAVNGDSVTNEVVPGSPPADKGE